MRSQELLLWFGEAAEMEARRERKQASETGDVAETAIWAEVCRDLRRREAARSARAATSINGRIDPGHREVFNRLIEIVRDLFDVANGMHDQRPIRNTCASAWQILDLCPPSAPLRQAIDELTSALTAMEIKCSSEAPSEEYPVEVEIAVSKLLLVKWWSLHDNR